MSASILIADDEPVIRDLMRAILEGSGYRVATASDGREAIEEIDHREYDLVISDILMPEVDGLELIRHLRRRRPDTKILAMSGAVNRIHLKTACAFGASGTLLKPFRLDTVRAAVSELLPD